MRQQSVRLGETLAGVLDAETAENLANIMDTVNRGS